MTTDPDRSPTIMILDGMTDDEWDTEIAHTPHLAAQAACWSALDHAAEGAADLSGGGPAND